MYYKTFNESGWGNDWTSIGGNFTSAPTIAATGDAGFHCFGMGADGTVKHKAWGGDSNDESWEASPWSSV